MKLYKCVLPLMVVCMLMLTYVFYNVYTFFYADKQVEVVRAYNINISLMQTNLKNLGYYKGDITGRLDSKTTDAVREFQASKGLNITGKIDYVTAQAAGVYSSNDSYLIAKCIHAEARGESYVGKVAVGAVILNRVASPDFPNTIYGVVYQPWAFTAVHDGQINLEPNNEAHQAAQDALNGWDPTYGSLYYYNPSVATSSWIFSREVVVTIGKHVFAI